MMDALYAIDLIAFAIATMLMFLGLATIAALALMFFAGYWRP